MSEKTLADPLSGREIKTILVQEIERRLNGDSTLLDDLAYAGFNAKFDIKISFTRSMTPATLVWGEAGQKPPEGIATETVKERDVVADSYASNPAPDVERQNHNLPVPVMVQTPTGPVRRRVQIERTK